MSRQERHGKNMLFLDVIVKEIKIKRKCSKVHEDYVYIYIYLYIYIYIYIYL